MSNKVEGNNHKGNISSPRKRHGMLIVVSSPSGGGKSSLIRQVLNFVLDVGYSVSYTTRAPRAGEVHGRDYFFVSVDEFLAMREAGKFLEWAYVHGNAYGTEAEQVKREVSEGRDIILEIDVKGAENVRRLESGDDQIDAVLIFVLPPSYEILRERLKARGSELPDDRKLRLANARHEVEEYSEFDYVIINDNADIAARQLASIISAERARSIRQKEAAQAVLETFAPRSKSDKS